MVTSRVLSLPPGLLRLKAGLALGWLVLLWLAWPAVAQVPTTASQGSPAEPKVIQLDDQAQRISLAELAWVWIDDSGKAEAAQAWGVFHSDPPSSSLQLRQSGKLYDVHTKAMWLHFSAHNLKPSAHWKLQVDLSVTDEATLYYQRADGSWLPQQAGDAIAHTRWTVRDHYPLFSLSDQTAVPVNYLLRIAHQRVPFSADVFISNDETVLGARQLENLFLGCYFGMMLAVVVMCISNGLVLRYSNYFRYAVYVGMLGITQLGYLGFFTQYVTPDFVSWNSVASFVLPTFSVATAMWFINALVRPAQFSPWMHRWMQLLIVMLVLIATVETLAPSVIGFRISNTLIIISMVTLYLLLWQSSRMGDRNARWIALGFLPVVITGLIPVLRNFGLLGTGFFTQYGLTIGSALEVPLLMYALMRRSASLRDMRVREQALLQQDALTGLADQRRFFNKLHSSLLRARRHRHRIGLLHVRVSNFAYIQREFGAQTANAALLLTASQLRNVGRDIDMPARLQHIESHPAAQAAKPDKEADTHHEADFALLVEGPVTAPRLIEMATHLLAQSLRPSDLLPVGLQPKLKISVALLPDDEADALGEDASTQYKWVISLVELAEQDEGESRKAIRALNF
jgi:two-component system, sensor histidine kinase LadS